MELCEPGYADGEGTKNGRESGAQTSCQCSALAGDGAEKNNLWTDCHVGELKRRKFALLLQNKTMKEASNDGGNTWKGWVGGAREQRRSSSIMQRWALEAYGRPIAFQYELIHAIDMLGYRMRKVFMI